MERVMVQRVLLGLAVLCFVLAAIGVTLGANVSFLAAGLALFAAAFLVAEDA